LTRVSRPALERFTSIGSGPIRGFWRQPGSLNDNWLVVSGSGLYLYDPIGDTSVPLGVVPGSDYAQFAGNEDRAICVREGVAYVTDGTSLTTITMPEPGQQVQTVAQIDGSFLLGVSLLLARAR
jgi:hypothetical protein